MVSENPSMASAMDVTSQCFISDIGGGFVNPQAFDTACQWSRRNQEDITYANAVPPDFEAQRSNIYRTGYLVRSNVSKDPEFSGSGDVYMDMQRDKENEHQGFYSGHGQRLSLTLNCQRQNDQLEEDPRQWHRPGTTYPGSDCMLPRYGSGTCAVMDSGPSSSKVASTACFLRNPRYLRLAQQLLDEVVHVSDAADLDSVDLFKRSRSVGITMQNVATALQPGHLMSLHEREALFLRGFSSKEKHGVQTRTVKLISMLDELDRKYEKYCHQIDGVISSFEAVAGLGAAKPYIALTIQAMTCHFSNLRETILSQLQALRESLLVCGNPRKIPQLSSSRQNHTQTTGVIPNLGIIPHQQVWRPLRGLPENSVAILRTWLFEHFLHPYPNESEKVMLSSQTGLTRSQISNWFINARVRLWKPMIEEMYNEEFTEETNNSNPTS